MAKKKGMLESFEDSVRSVTSKAIKPRTGAGSTTGRQQGVGPAKWDNSSSNAKTPKKGRV